MSKETPVLVAKKREKLGTRYTRRMRDAGQMPANVYGHGAAPLAIALDSREILNALKKGTHVLELKFDDGKSDTVLVKDLQFGYLGDNVIHLDLARVNLDEVVKVKVHLTFVGAPEASRKPGAILVHEMAEIEISCKVRAIPEEIKVDLSTMGETLTVAQIKLPAGVAAVSDPDHIVCRVEVVKEEAAAEATPAEGKAEPEVLTAKKEEAAPAADAAKKK
ncbi:MAG: 50S ribosomal protein L25 [Phycisphaerales bacterium]